MAGTLGSRWRTAREAKGFGANELDRLIGQTSGYTSRVERNEKPGLTATVAAKAAKALDVSLEWLLDGVGPMARQVGTSTVTMTYRYDSLREVIATYPERWSSEAISAVCTASARADSDPGHAHWIERLDRMQSAVKLADPDAVPRLSHRGDTIGGRVDDLPAWPPKARR